ncbi:MAG: phosphatase [Candidatus Sericytochromatia bacterium]|nr:phosphatase [Candidatus Tanganyikabacteria bacterium]
MPPEDQSGMTLSLANTLLKLELAGQTPNLAAANRHAIDRLPEGDPFYTFGIRSIGHHWQGKAPDREALARLMARHLGQNETEPFLEGPGTIEAEHAATQWCRALRKLDALAALHGTLAIGTGHPGAMLGLYRAIARRFVQGGGNFVAPASGQVAAVDGWVDDLGRVAILSDGRGALHTHATSVLDSTLVGRERVDLVIGDHGAAGAALNAGMACIALMDTNDPALAVAQKIHGHELLVVPTYDNLTNARTASVCRAFPIPKS